MAKQFDPQEKAKLEKLMTDIKPTLAELDAIDLAISTTAAPTVTQLNTWAREAVGKGNYIRKKQAKMKAAKKNESAQTYMELKVNSATSGAKFVSAAADRECDAYVAPLRTVRDVLEAYVVSADNIVSVCRMHLKQVESGNGVDL